jgi:hypothetical protein
MKSHFGLNLMLKKWLNKFIMPNLDEYLKSKQLTDFSKEEMAIVKQIVIANIFLNQSTNEEAIIYWQETIDLLLEDFKNINK